MAVIYEATVPRTEDLLQLLASWPQPRVPAATYRLQFHAGFTFRDARRLVPYLHELGVTDVYASPYLKARAGSAHGYDIANPNSLNPEIGTEEDYRAFVEELAGHAMGQVLDTVPNHMGIGDVNNVWWQDVLENGPSSVYADFFDIDWTPLAGDQHDADKVVLPILGDQYGLVLERGELRLAYEDDIFVVRYYDFRLPLAPETYAVPLEDGRQRWLEAANPGQADELQRLENILQALRDLPPRRRTDPEGREDRNRQKELIKHQLAALYDESSAFRRALGQTLAGLNGHVGDPASFDALDTLLEQQSYRLAFWRVAAEEINYRRFFDINDLAAVRVEDPQVFQATHALLLVLIRLGAVSGVRIDHPDGLHDPRGHLWRLQRSCFVDMNVDRVREILGGDAERDAIERVLGDLFDARAMGHDARLPLYTVVEKILAAGEQLPRDWPVNGTTGYDFLNLVNGLFVDRTARGAMDGIYSRFTEIPARWPDLSNSARKMVMLVSLPGEINGLAYRLKRLALRDRRHRDFTLNALTFAVREFLAALPVYRTYIDPDTGEMGDSDRAVIEHTAAEVKRRNPRTDPTIFDFVRDQLLGIYAISNGDAEGRLQFVARFQQVSGPVMAKGVEDTAFYQFNRLVSLNEVGGDPDQFGISVSAFHRGNARRAQGWPYSLLATSTHDNKRSEDVRARINVLSELSRQWRAAVTRWHRLNVQRKPMVDGRPAPDRNEEYLLYQTLVGAWPLEDMDDRAYAEFRGRITGFMLKAAKEAKVNTSWINPNASHEEAISEFVAATLDRSQPNPFLEDFLVFQRSVANAGMFNSLSQTLLKFASPGVADLYQGNEVWDFSLVDPDNRRPVDYKLRRQLLAEVQRRAAGDRAGFAAELLKTREDGRIKLYVTHTCLAARREHAQLFVDGDYVPLRTEGVRSAHVCAFARELDGRVAIAVSPVLVAGLMRSATEPVGDELWGGTRLILPARLAAGFRDVFTGTSLEPESSGGRTYLPLRCVLDAFPVALLVSL